MRIEIWGADGNNLGLIKTDCELIGVVINQPKDMGFFTVVQDGHQYMIQYKGSCFLTKVEKCSADVPDFKW